MVGGKLGNKILDISHQNVRTLSFKINVLASHNYYYDLDASTWSVSDVSEWLASKGLDQYVDSFRQNEISGSILIDLSLQDLDYMNVTILAHRKVLLNGIEELANRSQQKVNE